MYFGRSFWPIINISYRFTVGQISITHISRLVFTHGPRGPVSKYGPACTQSHEFTVSNHRSVNALGFHPTAICTPVHHANL